MSKPISHVVRRPGRKPGDADVEIPVAADLASVPGIPVIDADVSFYSRVEPLKSQAVEKSAEQRWAETIYTDDVAEYKKGHYTRVKPLVDAAAGSGDLEPTAEPVPGRDVTDDIRRKARELGFGEVGFTRYDRRYTYVSNKSWVKFTHTVCLALEQDYDQTQSIPSIEAEYAHFGSYELAGGLCLELAAFIRDLGYRAQIHSPNDTSSPYIPMFVSAGLGQLGANGQLLSPHFGSRSRLMMITTDAPVTYDQPVDYGIHKFCQICQVCANRCPGRALVREKVWWRGTERNKLTYERCRPVQKFSMKPVMERYIETGEVIGKGTEDLEGYSLRDKGHFGPGELPHFDREFFEIPHGRQEDWLFEQFKQRLASDGALTAEELSEFGAQVGAALDKNAPVQAADE